MKNKNYKILLGILLLILISVNYNSIDTFVTKSFGNEEYITVDRVIDGDTVVVNGTSVRMLGINTPERGEKYYTEAKDYTSGLVMNKTIKIERKGKDRYDRELAYLFYNGENINAKLVEVGYANAYFPEGKDNYYYKFTDAWKKCIESNENLCKKSSDKCAECIIIKKFGPDEELVLFNSCDFNCNMTGWSIKDEGRKKFVFEDFILKSKYQATITAEDFNQNYVWTNTGDTMFLRDEKEEMVLWEGY